MNRFVIILSILGSATVASAEPSVLTSLPPASPHYYVGGGAMAGVDMGLDSGATAEAGYHLGTGPLWLHAELARGSQVNDQGSGQLENARAGLELRPCWVDGIACAVVGVDLGLQHTTWVPDPADGMQPGASDNLIAVPRVGLDIGSRLRFRPGIETYHAIAGDDIAKGPLGLVGVNLTAAVAYEW